MKIFIILIFPIILFANSIFLEDSNTNSNQSNQNTVLEDNTFVDLENVQKAFLNKSSKTLSSIKNINYKENKTYKIQTRTLMNTMIVFSNDKIAGEPYYGNKGFIITKLGIGKYDLSNIVMIQPKYIGIDTNLTIIGQSGNIYSFYIYSTDYKSKSIPDNVVFIHNQETNTNKIKIVNLEKEEFLKNKKADNQAKKIISDPNYFYIGEGKNRIKIYKDQVIDDFVQDGAEDLKAKKIFRDNKFVYFKYDKDYSLSSFPAIFKVIDGFDSPINFRIVGDYLVAETIANKFTLRIENKHVCVRRLKDINHEKNKLKEFIIMFSILATIAIGLIIYGFIATAADEEKSPEFDKFLVNTNFPLNDYIYKEKKKPTDLSKGLLLEEKEKPKQKIKQEEETIKDKVSSIKKEILDKQKEYSKDIFQSKEEILRQQREEQKKNLLNSLYSDIPKAKIEKNSFEEKKQELDFGANKFSNLKNRNSVTNETKLYRTITADKRIPIILTSSINSALSGQVVGIVEDDIYASMGTVKLLPKGTKAIGNYRNNSQIGENRFELKWDRFITPQGIHVLLDDAQSADIKGNSGVLGVLDNRYWKRYGLPLTLSTISNSLLLAVSKATSDDSSKDNSNNTQIILDNSRQDLSYILKKSQMNK